MGWGKGDKRDQIDFNQSDPFSVLQQASNDRGPEKTKGAWAITQQINRMQGMSKVAARGGVALSIVGLGIACHEMSLTDDVDRKNDIFVETVGSIAGGIAFGAAAGAALLFMATPAGWISALIVGAVSVAGGYVTSQGASAIYDASGRKIDFANSTGVASLCSRPSHTPSKYTLGFRISDAGLSVL